MLNINERKDALRLSLYGKTKGILTARKCGLPTFSNLYVIESKSDIERLLRENEGLNDFYMRADTEIGNHPIKVGGKNGNRQKIFDYYEEVEQESKRLGIKGVIIVYWNNGRFCPTYETEGSFYLDYKYNDSLTIEYVGKGWDGSYLSHGTACHETFFIPWSAVGGLDGRNIHNYKIKHLTQEEYSELRNNRIKDLLDQGFKIEEIDNAVPSTYTGIDRNTFDEVVINVILPMYNNSEIQRAHKEYIPIVQIEYGNLVVPEVILPERLKVQSGQGSGEREN